MALARPDYKYQEAKKLIEEMKGKKGELIRYYVSENKKWYDKLQERNEEMREVFAGISKFTR